MPEIDEKIKNGLLELLSSVEASLPMARAAIEKGEFITTYPNTYYIYTKFMGTLPDGQILDSATIIMGMARNVKFSFPDVV